MAGLGLYKWPEPARFGRTIPKSKFYEHGIVSKSIRDGFVAEVEKIVWAFKLSEGTLNLAPTEQVPEIQVFSIQAKGHEVSEQVLAAMDRAVMTPIIFEVIRGVEDDAEVQMVAAIKQIVNGKVSLGPYSFGAWQKANQTRISLPTAITLPTLYMALLGPLTGISARPGEQVSEVSERLDEVKTLGREISALETKIRNEPQLNRKVELRRSLRIKQTKLEQLR